MPRYAATDGLSVKAIVRAVLLENGDLTDEDLTDLVRFTIPDALHTTIRKRRDDLVREGYVRDSGERRLTRAGRSAIVWHAVDDDEPAPDTLTAHLDLAPQATSLALQLWRSWGMPERGLEHSFWQTVEAVRVGLTYREEAA